jgi:hypothetical protein
MRRDFVAGAATSAVVVLGFFMLHQFALIFGEVFKGIY